MPVLIAGCGNRQGELPKPPASTTVGTEIDDTVVTTKVKSVLFAAPAIKSFDLKVETRKGAVQLSGFVDNQAQILGNGGVPDQELPCRAPQNLPDDWPVGRTRLSHDR